METLVEPGDCFEKWHQVTCRSYSLTQCPRQPDAQFSARVSARKFGSLGLNEIQSSTGEGHPIQVARGPSDIRRDPRDDFFLWFALGGSPIFDQDGRTVRMSPGDLVLHDQSRPFTIEFDGWCHAAMVAIPRALLTSRLSDADQLVARSIGRDTTLGALAGSMVRHLLDMQGGTSPAIEQSLSSAALDVWSATLEGELIQQRGVTTQGAGRLSAAKRYMQTHLDDVELDLDTIAKACHMAPRTLIRLFATEGVTPIRWLWQQRLDASYKALAEGHVLHVSQAALDFGFSDLSHFSRAFKAAFGKSPKEVRRVR